jgi:hypothetical protein
MEKSRAQSDVEGQVPQQRPASTEGQGAVNPAALHEEPQCTIDADKLRKDALAQEATLPGFARAAMSEALARVDELFPDDTP